MGLQGSVSPSTTQFSGSLHAFMILLSSSWAHRPILSAVSIFSVSNITSGPAVTGLSTGRSPSPGDFTASSYPSEIFKANVTYSRNAFSTLLLGLSCSSSFLSLSPALVSKPSSPPTHCRTHLSVCCSADPLTGSNSFDGNTVVPGT